MSTVNAVSPAPATAPAPTTAGTRAVALNWWQASLFGAVTATTINLAIWAAATLAGASLTLLDGGEPYLIDAGSVVFSSALPMVAGIVLAAVISRWWPAVIRLAQVLGALAAVATLWSVFAYGVDAATITTLTLMHLVSGVVVVLALEGLRRHTRRQPAQQPAT